MGNENHKTVLYVGYTFALLSSIACIMAFSLPSWIYTYRDDSEQGINYAGLWTFCLETFYDPSQRGRNCDSNVRSSCFNGGVPMYGCHWIYSDELKEIRWTVLNPPFYIAVQIMATLNLILSLLCLIGLTFYLASARRKSNSEDDDSGSCALIFGIVSQFFCAALGLCESVLYALRVTDLEFYDVPNIQAKSLGAGWGWAVVAFILAGLATCFLAITRSYINGSDRDQKDLNKARHLEEDRLVTRREF